MSFISASSSILLLVLSVVVQHAAAESFIGKAVDTGKFNILNAALAEYDITGLLNNLGGAKVTVFGPTDDALVAAGVSGPSDLPQATLLRHAVLGTYTAATLTASTCQEIISIPGGKLVVQTRLDGSITVNGVSVNAALADITGDEGVFHGIDGVIPAEYPSCEATETTSAPGPTAAPVAAPAASESSAHPMKAAFLAVTLVGAVMSIVL